MPQILGITPWQEIRNKHVAAAIVTSFLSVVSKNKTSSAQRSALMEKL